ncbi:MAG TPA: hypothetical protein VHH54_04240 [Actinomycetota bacterium]|nr:hypothetical protein [Actinomycetota bacterium]
MSTATKTLIDEVLPEFDFGSRHGRRVAAPPEGVAEAVEMFQFSRAAAFLIKLRGIRPPSGSIRDVLTQTGFTVLAERPRAEVVFGINGQFWALRELGHLESPRDLDSFRAFDRPGWAQGTVSVRIDPLDDGSTYLMTETRVRCVDEAARRRFVIYWRLIKPFSDWIRRDFLRRIARMAEGAE